MSSPGIISTRFSRLRSSSFLLFSLLFLVASAQIPFLFPRNACAVDVTVTWDANSEGDLAGYRVFYREEDQSYNFNEPDWEGSDTTCAISDLDENTTYYFVARAFDTSGNESGNSNEVYYQHNLAPTADAGPDQTVNEGVTATLNGSNSSDPDGSIASYQWTQTGGTSVTLSDINAEQPTFMAPNVGPVGASLTFRLRVTDNGGLQSTDTCIVNVTWQNEPPAADAGPDQTVNEGATVALDGSDSMDTDGSIAFYQWTQTAGTPVTLSGATSATPIFIAPDVGTGGETLTFQLTVTDDGGLQASDSCIVNVSWVNLAPTADAGPDQTVNEGVTATLNGSNSSDPDGSIASYQWTQTAGIPVTLSDATSATPTFTAPDVGAGGETLTFQVTVTDDGGLQAADSCIVNVSWVDESPTLSSVSINGASSVNENATSNYAATATFSDGTTETVTESVTWTEDSSFATINGDGVLSVSEVMSDQAVTITASYTYDDVTETDQKVVTITDIPQSNLPPISPVITSPYYGQMECDLLLHITTGPFSDPDGDTHGQSRWQISKQEDFSSLILDVTSTEHLTELTVPRTVLEPDTTYYVRVQFYDAYLVPSEWSDTIEFTTTSDANDLDADGIPDDQEVGDDVDLNEDGIADNYQPDVIKCVQSDIDNTTIGVSTASNSIAAIEAVGTIDPSTISDKTNKPERFFSQLFFYRLSLHEPGATATIRIYFSKDISSADTFFKYDTISGWQDYSEHTTFNDDGRSVTLEVKDGSYGDSDGVANGIIVDPSALAEATDGVETSEGTGSGGDDGGGSSGGGCFIATAAFGSYAEPHVKLLRDFRDQCLLTNTPGRWFVRVYYRYGPFWADLINTHTWSKPVVRLALMPLVGTSYVLIKASVAMRILAGFLLVLFMLGCFVRMHGRPVTGGEQP